MKKNCAIIKIENIDAVLHHENNSLIMTNSHKEEILLWDNALPCFNTLSTPKGDALVFYRDISGEAYLARLTPFGKSESRRLMPCEAFTDSFDCVCCQSRILGSCFFYSLPMAEKNMHALYVTDFSNDGGIKLDSIIPMQSTEFYCFTGETPVLVYRNQQNSLTMCVFNGKNLSNHRFYTLAQRADNVSDVSCLVENEFIHICYTVMQQGSAHLMYKQLSKEGLSGGRVLNSQKTLTGCLLFMSQETLFVFSTSKNMAYYTFSKDMGGFFYPSAVYFKPLNVTNKANYTVVGEHEFRAQEVFMSDKEPLLIDDFSTPPPPKEPDFTTEDIIRLRGKIINFEKELKEKNLQVSEMSKTVSQTQEQNTSFLQQWKSKYDRLQIEYQKISDTVKLAENENETLKQQISEIKEKETENTKRINRLTDENIALKKTKSLLEEEIYRVNNMRENQ